MEKKIAGVTLEQANKNLLWVVKHDGYREVITGAELDARGEWWKDESILDVDVAAKQTDPIMQNFLDKWEELNKKHGWMTMWELFENHAE